jgi:hypothetical protein
MIQRSTWACAVLATSLCLPLVARAQVTPVAEGAQAVGPRTHTVREGETLWEIARLYLRDPFLWPEVYRLNTSVVEDPHWIFPGEQLALPDAAATVSPIITAAAAPPTTPEDVGPPTVSEGPTIFRQGTAPRPRPTPIAGRRTSRVDVRIPPPPIREWEYYAAPWVEAVGGPRDYGRILMTSEIQGIGARIDRTHIQLSEKIYITTPASVAPQRGDRYLVYSLGPQLPGLGQVVLPTGIVEVLVAGAEGEATTVRVVKQFDEIGPEHRVTLLDPLVMPASNELTAVGEGLTTDIRWMQNTPLLPTIQQYVVLGASARDGVQLGDRFTFLRGRTRFNGTAIPEEEIAEAQVIRVTDRGVTAIVIDQTHPSIREGMMARLTAVTPEVRR